MRNIAKLIAVVALLSGCTTAEERQAMQERWQQYVNQCRNQGGVIYRNQCMTREAAAEAQQQDFLAAEAEKNRRAMVEAACVSRGGQWLSGLNQCQGGKNEVNVNVRRYY